MYCPQLSAKKSSVFWKCVSYVPQEDRGTRAGGKSQFKAVMLLIFTHLFSLDIYPPLVGVDLRLRTLCRDPDSMLTLRIRVFLMEIHTLFS